MEAHDSALKDQGVAVALEDQVVGSAFVEEVVDDPLTGASVAEVDHRAIALEVQVVGSASVAELGHAFGFASAEAFADREAQAPFRELFQHREAYLVASHQS